MSFEKKKGAFYGAITGDILGNATHNMSKEEIYDTYCSFGFGIDSAFTPDKIVIDRNRNTVQKGDWSYITDNMLLIMSMLKNTNIIDAKDYIRHNLLNYNNTDKISHLLVFGLIYKTKKDIIKYTLSLCNVIKLEAVYSIPLIFSNLLIYHLTNHNNITDIDTDIDNILTFITNNIFTNNKNIISIIKQYTSYTNYEDIKEHKNIMLKSLAYSIITLRKVMNGYSYMDAVMEIIREGGNAHSNAFMVGMICGSYLEYENIPTNISSNIQYKERLDYLAELMLYKI